MRKKKHSPAKKSAAKAGKTISKKNRPTKPAVSLVKKEKTNSNKAADSRSTLRNRILGANNPAKPIDFSLDEGGTSA